MPGILNCPFLFLPEFVEWPILSQLTLFHSGTTVIPKLLPDTEDAVSKQSWFKLARWLSVSG